MDNKAYEKPSHHMIGDSSLDDVIKECISVNQKKYNLKNNVSTLSYEDKVVIDLKDSYHHLAQVLKNDVVGDIMVHQGNPEPEIEYVIRDNFNGVKVAVDAGTNYGQFALIMAKNIAQGGKVLSYEINPKTVECVQATICLNGYSDFMTVFPYALSNTNGEATIMLSNNDSYSSSLVTNNNNEHYDHIGRISNELDFSSFKVHTVKLDDHIYEMFGNYSVEFIRLDIEGSECNALEGAYKVITNSPNIVISIEWQKSLIHNMVSDDMDYYDYSTQCLGFLIEQDFSFYSFAVNGQDVSYQEINASDIIDQEAIEFIATRNNFSTEEQLLTEDLPVYSDL